MTSNSEQVPIEYQPHPPVGRRNAGLVRNMSRRYSTRESARPPASQFQFSQFGRPSTRESSTSRLIRDPVTRTSTSVSPTRKNPFLVDTAQSLRHTGLRIQADRFDRRTSSETRMQTSFELNRSIRAASGVPSATLTRDLVTDEVLIDTVVNNGDTGNASRASHLDTIEPAVETTAPASNAEDVAEKKKNTPLQTAGKVIRTVLRAASFDRGRCNYDNKQDTDEGKLSPPISNIRDAARRPLKEVVHDYLYSGGHHYFVMDFEGDKIDHYSKYIDQNVEPTISNKITMRKSRARKKDLVKRNSNNAMNSRKIDENGAYIPMPPVKPKPNKRSIIRVVVDHIRTRSWSRNRRSSVSQSVEEGVDDASIESTTSDRKARARMKNVRRAEKRQAKSQRETRRKNNCPVDRRTLSVDDTVPDEGRVPDKDSADTVPDETEVTSGVDVSNSSILKTPTLNIVTYFDRLQKRSPYSSTPIIPQQRPFKVIYPSEVNPSKENYGPSTSSDFTSQISEQSNTAQSQPKFNHKKMLNELNQMLKRKPLPRNNTATVIRPQCLNPVDPVNNDDDNDDDSSSGFGTVVEQDGQAGDALVVQSKQIDIGAGGDCIGNKPPPKRNDPHDIDVIAPTS